MDKFGEFLYSLDNLTETKPNISSTDTSTGPNEFKLSYFKFQLEKNINILVIITGSEIM